MKKLIITIAVILAILGYFIVNRIVTKGSQDKTTKIAKNIFIEAETAIMGNIEGKLYYTGNVEGVHEATVISQTSGIVEKLNFAIGNRCSEGQVIAVVQNAQQQAGVEQAKAQVLAAESNYEKANLDLKRIEKLNAENVATKDNLELMQLNVKSAMAQLRGAQAGLKVAEKQLADTYIKAAISGFIATKDIEKGGTVMPGSKIAHITDVSKLKIRIMVNETDVIKLKPGKIVSVKIDAMPEKNFAGVISNIGYATENGMRSYPIEVVVDNTKGMDIKSGMFARCEIIAESKENTLVIPENAVVLNNDLTTHVFVVENGVAKKKIVTLGVKGDGKYEVVSGLSNSDKVVTTGKERLVDGVSVKEQI